MSNTIQHAKVFEKTPPPLDRLHDPVPPDRPHNQDMCLVSLLHDPKGKLASLSYRYFHEIRKLYTDIVIETTLKTKEDERDYGFGGKEIECPDPERVDRFITIGRIQGVSYVESAKSLGEARRRALWTALDKTNCDFFHFCDFDRLLWWYMNFPEELRQVICGFKTEKMVVLGRTQAAMESHPWLQEQTERICNNFFTVEFGHEMDILAASRIIPRHLAVEILKESKEENPACIDAEWPMIVGPDRIQYLEVNGLGYESALLGIEKTWEDEVEARLGHLNSLARMLL